ncbi:MAG: hypothetical protein M3440_13725 [Chloroflexota bacterium]|nr:hypothetical protein [Chloroflexota bacterium]
MISLAVLTVLLAYRCGPGQRSALRGSGFAGGPFATLWVTVGWVRAGVWQGKRWDPPDRTERVSVTTAVCDLCATRSVTSLQPAATALDTPPGLP